MDTSSFVTIDYAFSYAGMMAICWIVVQCAKYFRSKSESNLLRTRTVVLIVALALVLAKTAYEFDYTTFFADTTPDKILMLISAIILWPVNTVVVWTATMKSHELLGDATADTKTSDDDDTSGDSDDDTEEDTASDQDDDTDTTEVEAEESTTDATETSTASNETATDTTTGATADTTTTETTTTEAATADTTATTTPKVAATVTKA